MTSDMAALAQDLAEKTRAYVAKSIGELATQFGQWSVRLTAIEQRIATIKDGEPGPAGLSIIGPPGEPGPPGKEAAPVTLEQIRAGITAEMIDAAVFTYLQTHPPARGDKGEPGQIGVPGRDGRDGLPGVPGSPGEKGLDGRHGTDGRDGAGIDDIQVEHDGGRMFAIKFVQGDRVKQIGTFTVPVMMFQGVWNKASTYEYQDVVSWGGSMWVCMYPNTTAQPGAEVMEPKAWMKGVSKGSEGKVGPAGKEGNPGQRGEKGIDGMVYR